VYRTHGTYRRSTANRWAAPQSPPHPHPAPDRTSVPPEPAQRSPPRPYELPPHRACPTASAQARTITLTWHPTPYAGMREPGSPPRPRAVAPLATLTLAWNDERRGRPETRSPCHNHHRYRRPRTNATTERADPLAVGGVLGSHRAVEW